MDSFLIDYLNSGKAWVLVGSGPSIEMGYPSWHTLAMYAREITKLDRPDFKLGALDAALSRQDFPRVFEEAKAALGSERLLQALQTRLIPSQSTEIYQIIARWPIPVYLTTNYDNEIQTQLAKLGEAYIPYSNSADHFGYLHADLSGAVFKLHGDLRSSIGLILTSSDYRAIAEDDHWQYWRTKMTSVFQMNRLIVIGHSLTDANIRHVLGAAKLGTGVHQPICWVAPDATGKQAQEYLEKYRIRVIPYDNRDGDHRNLHHLLANISEFVPSRTKVHIQHQIAQVSQSPLGENAAAPSFFVFNKLATGGDYEGARLNVVIAAIQSTLPVLASKTPFTIKKALEIAGWPSDCLLPYDFEEQIRLRAVELQLFEAVGDHYKVGTTAIATAAEHKERFEHMRERFKESLKLRLKRKFPALQEEGAITISRDIESSLTGYFKEGGLSLATTLFSSTAVAKQNTLPSSIIKFISEASARYDDLLWRQAFFTISVEAFVEAEAAERDYLGRISQGFFAFHSLGAFGDVAVERLKQAQNTVWLIDSSVQIPILAFGAATHLAFINCVSRLHEAGVRVFTTEKLFRETYQHYGFASKVIKTHGGDAPEVVAAAKGEPPFRKSNQFLEGFVRWQSTGNPPDWGNYNFQIFGIRNPHIKDVERALVKHGVEVVDFQDWPGFKQADFHVSKEYLSKIIELRDRSQPESEDIQSDQTIDAHRKAEPEGEALVIVKRERDGDYYIISQQGEHSPSWFISQTSILNTIEKGPRITWQPEAFLRFTSTLLFGADSQASDHAFEALLWGLAQSGLSLLDEKTIESAFGGIIDQATINLEHQRQLYETTLEEKYGESLDEVMSRLSPSNKPWAALQLANEMAQSLAHQHRLAQVSAAKEKKRAELAEKQLRDVERFRRKMEEKRMRGRRKARKQTAKGKKR